MTPSHPLFRRFENELTVGERQLEWMTEGESFVFRPLGGDETVVLFLFKRAYIKGFLLAQPDDATTADNVAEVKNRLENALLGHRFWRLWRLPSGEECFLHRRYGIFRVGSGELVRFDYPRMLPHIGRMQTENIDQFLEELAAYDSDLEKARLWAMIPKQERVRQLFTLQGGSFDEFESLIRGALTLSGDLETCFALRDVMIMPGRVTLQYEAPRGAGEPHPVERFFEIINRYFQLERTNEEWRGHDDFGDPEDVPYPVYTCSQPNQHELLEAVLDWRNFLRDKMTPEEIDVLFKS